MSDIKRKEIRGMKTKKSAALIEEDRHLIEQIRSAISFTAHIRISPSLKFTTRNIATAGEAFTEAERLRAEHSKFGRRGLVYAITPRGDTVPVSREHAAEAGRL